MIIEEKKDFIGNTNIDTPDITPVSDDSAFFPDKQIEKINSKVLSGEIPVGDLPPVSATASNSVTSKYIDGDTELSNLGMPPMTLITRLYKSKNALNANTVCGKNPSLNNYKAYTLDKVKALCEDLKNNAYIIVRGSMPGGGPNEDFKYAQSLNKFPNTMKHEYIQWYNCYTNKCDKNLNGRYGLSFEIALGNWPDANPDADLEGATQADSVEAKSKSSKSSSITVTTRRLESLKASLSQASKNVKDTCDKNINLITKLLNQYIVNDILNTYKNVNENYDIVYATKKSNSDITLSKLMDEKMPILCFSLDIVLQGKGLFNDRVVIPYDIYCAATENNFKSKAIKGNFCISFYIKSKNNKLIQIPEVVELSPELIIHSIIDKCPNIVIANGRDYDKIDAASGVELTVYEFSTFKYFTVNKNIKNLNKEFYKLITDKIFNVSIKISNGAAESNRSTGLKATKKHSLSLSISPSFNVNNLIKSANIGHGLYIEG